MLTFTLKASQDDMKARNTKTNGNKLGGLLLFSSSENTSWHQGKDLPLLERQHVETLK